MRNVKPLVLAAALLIVLAGQTAHRHDVHPAGLVAPHAECPLCAWADGVPSFAAAIPSAALSTVFLRFVSTLFVALPCFQSLTRVFDSRGPPAVPSV
jgi:hypothetical protein